LAGEQELTDSQAADLMCRLVAVAAGSSARRRATPARAVEMAGKHP
jgi:hypothetical protein